MSIKMPRGVTEGPCSSFRRAIQLVLFSSLLVLQPSDGRIVEPKEINPIGPSDGIKIVPSDKPKGGIPKEKNTPRDFDFLNGPFCMPETCKFG